MNDNLPMRIIQWMQKNGLNKNGAAKKFRMRSTVLSNILNGADPPEKYLNRINSVLSAPTNNSIEQEVIYNVKISLAKRNVAELSEILRWLLFEATVDERNRFRNELSENWDEFHILVRSLVNERSREIGIEEMKSLKQRS